jgi:hypothetical protein
VFAGVIVLLMAWQYLRFTRSYLFLKNFQKLVRNSASILSHLQMIVCVYVGVVLLRFVLRHTVYAYTGYMMDVRGKVSLRTKLWMVGALDGTLFTRVRCRCAHESCPCAAVGRVCAHTSRV